ncbi:MAG: sulfatase-like hydrolase/transferase [Planctomycetaceae bacterium]
MIHHIRIQSSIVAFVLGIALVGPARADSDAPQRPNIVWITCEDISAHLGCYGHEHARTPHLDRFAEQGVRYRRAFATAGVCAPSRSCIITGMYQCALGSQHMRSKATLPEHIRGFPEYLREAGYYCTNNSKTDYNFQHRRQTWDESSGKAHWKHRRPGQPFFAVFNITGTHESQIWGGDPSAELREKLELPPYYPDTPAVRRDWARYHELIAAMDRRVGELLAELEDAGLADDTIVFYYSDHGAGMPRAKRWLYDSGMHVPFIVRWPGKLNGGTVEDRLVSFVDLAPTVLSLAGVPIPEHLQGKAFLGAKAAEPREYVFAARDRMDERHDFVRAVRDRRFKYLRNYDHFQTQALHLDYAERNATMKELRRLHAEGKLDATQSRFLAPSRPPEELYDLEGDPHEIRNLAGSPEHAETLDRFRRALEQWQIDIRDTGFLPEPELVAHAGREGIYATVREDEELLPLARLHEVSRLSIAGKESLPGLTRALKDESAAVRYRAAIGLLALGIDAASAKPALEQALEDESPSVRIAAARALCGLGDADRGVKVLIEALGHPQGEARMLAIDFLDALPVEQSRPAFAAVERVEPDQGGYVARIAEHLLAKLRPPVD